MKQFAKLCFVLRRASSIAEKELVLRNYFQVAEPDEIGWAVYVLMHPISKRLLTTQQLKSVFFEAEFLPAWLVEASIHASADLAEALAIIPGVPAKESNQSLQSWVLKIEVWQQLSRTELQKALVEAWMSLDSSSRWVLNKIITGTFRNLVEFETIVQALSKFSGESTQSLTLRLSQIWHPAQHVFSEILFTKIPAEISASFLTYPEISSTNIPSELPVNIHDWLLIRNAEGVLAQFILRDQQWFLWSPEFGYLHQQFPEFNALLPDKYSTAVILVKLVIPGKGESSDQEILNKRIKNRSVSQKLITDFSANLIALDLLELNGQSLLESDVFSRRKNLRELMLAGNLSLISLSEEIPVSSRNDIENYCRNNSPTWGVLCIPEFFQNGLSPVLFTPGNLVRSAIVVLLYVAQGRGSRMYNELTVAILKNNEFVPFTKVENTLNDEENLRLENFVLQNTVEKFGPVKRLNLGFNLEIGFRGLRWGTRHKIGFSVIEPHILDCLIDFSNQQIARFEQFSD